MVVWVYHSPVTATDARFFFFINKYNKNVLQSHITYKGWIYSSIQVRSFVFLLLIRVRVVVATP